MAGDKHNAARNQRKGFSLLEVLSIRVPPERRGGLPYRFLRQAD